MSRFANKLEILGRGKIYIREESIELNRGYSGNLKIVFLSDLHLGAFGTQDLERDIIEVVKTIGCDIILIGGDLVDNRRALYRLGKFLKQLQKISLVGLVFGNHDYLAGLKSVEEVVLESQVKWLEAENYNLINAGLEFEITGKIESKKTEKNKIRILCAHDPKVYPEARKAGFDLVLAGHLHGGQIVLFNKQKRMYPAAWFYKLNTLRQDNDHSTLIVSRGLADTLPIRWNCPREVVVCTIRSF